ADAASARAGSANRLRDVGRVVPGARNGRRARSSAPAAAARRPDSGHVKLRSAGYALHVSHLGAIQGKDRGSLDRACADVVSKFDGWAVPVVASGSGAVQIVDAHDVRLAAADSGRVYRENGEVTGAIRSSGVTKGVLGGELGSGHASSVQTHAPVTFHCRLLIGRRWHRGRFHKHGNLRRNRTDLRRNRRRGHTIALELL